MARMGSVLKLAGVVVVLMMMVVAPHAEAALSCNEIVRSFIPCLSYLRNGGSVSSSCCDSVNSLNAGATTTTDRQAACACLKSASTSISGINAAYAANLPAACGVNLPYTISPTINCDDVNGAENQNLGMGSA